MSINGVNMGLEMQALEAWVLHFLCIIQKLWLSYFILLFWRCADAFTVFGPFRTVEGSFWTVAIVNGIQQVLIQERVVRSIYEPEI